MIIDELLKLPATEKLKIIEALWSDLVDTETGYLSPLWHESELKQTEQEFMAGQIEVLDWQAAKKELLSSF